MQVRIASNIGFALVLFAVASPVSAQITAAGFLEVHDVPTGSPIPPPDYEYTASESSTTESSVFVSMTDDLEYLNSSFTAQATWGSLRAKGTGHAIHPGDTPFQTTRYNADADFYEYMVITSPTVPAGTPGMATATFDLDGALSMSNQGTGGVSSFSARANLGLFAGVNGTFGGIHLGSFYRFHVNLDNGQIRWQVDRNDYVEAIKIVDTLLLGGSPAGYTINETVEIPFTFTFGTPFEIFANLSAGGLTRIDTSPGNGVTAIADGYNTANWQGISNMALVDGTPITEFSAVGTTSGVSYNGAIPEPSSASCLILAGLALLIRHRARANRRCAP